jgi:energy-coupling factor transport system ATP-binding protein
MEVRAERITFRYPSGVLALREVSLTVHSGESVAIVGENGAGKTTLARHFNGLLRPQTGEVWVGDWDTRQVSVARLSARVAYVFQNPDDQLFARTVREEVAFGPRNLGRAPGEAAEAIETALERCGLRESADRHPYDLPPAERKFVAIAAALAMRSPVVTLDEPTTGVDARGAARLGSIVEGLQNEGKTVLTISHDLDFCAGYFERVVVMSGGRIIGDGPAREILRAADLLREAHVRPPQLISLAIALGIPGSPMTVPEFVHDYGLHRPKRRPRHDHRSR